MFDDYLYNVLYVVPILKQVKKGLDHELELQLAL